MNIQASKEDNGKTCRRIVLAIDASSSSISYLEKIAEIASTPDAHLSGLYIEDEVLLLAADLPLTKEICFHVTEKPISLQQMEKEMKLFSSQAEKKFEEIANRWKLDWSFQTVRGSVGGELMQAAKTADMLSFGLQVFGDLQGISVHAEEIHRESPCLIFPDRIANGEDIFVFASEEKSLEDLLAPVNGFAKKSRVIELCPTSLYSENKEKKASFLKQATRESEIVVYSEPMNNSVIEILANYNPILIIADRNAAFAKSKNFYSLMVLAKSYGLLV